MSSGTPPRPEKQQRSGGDIRRNSEPAPMGVLQLSTRRLRSNSGTHLPNDLNDLSIAEMNSIAPPSPIYKIVLTGGPCGGKTTSLARVSLFLYFFFALLFAYHTYHVQLSPYLRERGFEVITVPEAFSLLVSNGMAFDYLSAVEGMDNVVQDTVMDMQIGIEDRYVWFQYYSCITVYKKCITNSRRFLLLFITDLFITSQYSFERVLRARGKPGVLLCDRGLMDGSAYMSQEAWDRLLKKRDVQCVSELREGRYNAVYHLVTAAEGAEKFYTLENNAVRTESPELARNLDNMTRTAWVGQ